MGMGTSTGGGVQSEINITPLVDVVLVLLIIFMVAQPMMQHGYDSAIPRPDPNQQQTPPDPNVPTFILKLTADATSGELKSPILNNDTIARAELLERVRTEMTRVQARDRVVFIDCADNVNYNDLMRVVDDLKLADVRTVGFATEPITAN